MSKDEFKPENTTAKTTEKGPHGGGTPYNQLKFTKAFALNKPVTGHTQKQNIKP